MGHFGVALKIFDENVIVMIVNKGVNLLTEIGHRKSFRYSMLYLQSVQLLSKCTLCLFPEADPKIPKKKCINKVKLYSVLAMLGMLVVASCLVAFALFCKILKVQRLKSSPNRKITVFVSDYK